MREEPFQQPTRLTDDVKALTKGYRNLHNQLNETTMKSENKVNFNFDFKLLVRILRRIFRSKWDENGEWRRLHNEELHSLYRILILSG